MIIAFSFHRIMVNILLIMINILFTETEISSKNAKQAQYRVNRLLQALSLFQVCLQFLVFYILKHLKFKLSQENQNFRISENLRISVSVNKIFKLSQENQASVELYPDVLSQLDSDRASTTTTTTLFVPNSIGKYWRGVQAAPNNHRS